MQWEMSRAPWSFTDTVLHCCCCCCCKRSAAGVALLLTSSAKLAGLSLQAYLATAALVLLAAALLLLKCLALAERNVQSAASTTAESVNEPPAFINFRGITIAPADAGSVGRYRKLGSAVNSGPTIQAANPLQITVYTVTWPAFPFWY